MNKDDMQEVEIMGVRGGLWIDPADDHRIHEMGRGCRMVYSEYDRDWHYVEESAIKIINTI